MDTAFHRMLNQRRKELGMGYSDLARRSGVSMPTVVRILSGRYRNASFANVSAVATTLGVSIAMKPVATIEEMRERQAEAKARTLVGMVQATSSLEAQGLERQELAGMTRTTIHRLLSGSPRKLWRE